MNLKVAYIIIIYQDDNGMWYSSVKKTGGVSVKSDMHNKIYSLFRWIWQSVKVTL